MAIVHNAIIRSLNAIYQQAPHVTGSNQVVPFLGFCLAWIQLISAHHDGEEEICFPAIDRMTDEKGVMDIAVEQHAVFHDDLVRFQTYLAACQKGDEDFDGEKIRHMVDNLAPALVDHLHQEITTILELERFGADKMRDLPKVFEEEAKSNVVSVYSLLFFLYIYKRRNSQLTNIISVILKAKVGLAVGAVILLVSHDATYENHLWAKWPPLPAPLLFIVRQFIYCIHSDWWKFAPSDKYSRPKPQYVMPSTSL